MNTGTVHNKHTSTSYAPQLTSSICFKTAQHYTKKNAEYHGKLEINLNI